MIISGRKILKLNKRHDLVSDLCDRELNTPEGAGLDLRIGKVERMVSGSLICADNTTRERYSPTTEPMWDVERDGNKLITMKPGDYYVVSTMETVSAPSKRIWLYGIFPVHLMPDVYPRVSLQKGGVTLLCTKTDPGYRGKLVFGLANIGNQEFNFELGARMVNLVYHVVIGGLKRHYSGQHQGGRITSQGVTEKQN